MTTLNLPKKTGSNMNGPPETARPQNKLNVVSAVLRLGHAAFDKKGLDAVATHIVNNSKLIAGYERCCIVQICSG